MAKPSRSRYFHLEENDDGHNVAQLYDGSTRRCSKDKKKIPLTAEYYFNTLSNNHLSATCIQCLEMRRDQKRWKALEKSAEAISSNISKETAAGNSNVREDIPVSQLQHHRGIAPSLMVKLKIKFDLDANVVVVKEIPSLIVKLKVRFDPNTSSQDAKVTETVEYQENWWVEGKIGPGSALGSPDQPYYSTSLLKEHQENTANTTTAKQTMAPAAPVDHDAMERKLW